MKKKSLILKMPIFDTSSVWHSRFINICSVSGFLFIWWLITKFRMVEPVLLVSPIEVLKSAISLTLDGSLPVDVAVSLARVLQGFLIGFFMALPIGMFMGLSQTISSIVDPIVELLRPIPPIAWIPLAILWFGIGETSKIFIIAYGAFFPIMINTMAGFRAIDPIHILAAKTLGATKLQIFRNVMIKSAFPQYCSWVKNWNGNELHCFGCGRVDCL